MAERWGASIIMYSAAVSVKMNVLLMAPAVLVVLLKAGSPASSACAWASNGIGVRFFASMRVSQTFTLGVLAIALGSIPSQGLPGISSRLAQNQGVAEMQETGQWHLNQTPLFMPKLLRRGSKLLSCSWQGAEMGEIVQGACQGVALQMLLGAPFLLHSAQAYLGRAFELSRVFQHTWTVNLKFLPEPLFQSKGVALVLLLAHVLLLLAFAQHRYQHGRPCHLTERSLLQCAALVHAVLLILGNALRGKGTCRLYFEACVVSTSGMAA